ncbi:MAG: PKD domain-containing protein [Patescibacteria group bacterium]
MRYFDKTFFKFTLGFLVIVAISLLIMYAASAYAAGTSKIVILPIDPLTILPNTFSKQMTVQSQDESGPIKTIERINLTFESSSPTGQFFTATGNSLDSYKYIGADTTNRNFSYKDSTEGNFTITINAKGKDTAQEWNANQQIIISSGATQNPPNDNTSGEVLSANTESSSNTQSSGGSTVSRISSPSVQLEVLAGSDRTTSPGSPIWFQATVKKNTTGSNLDLSWSFGDGNVGVGPLVSHTYKYSGDYVVVLSAKAGDMFSVSRLKVKVGTPDILVSDGGEYLEISNNGNTEINLFNWKLEDEGKGFIFQPNTIILPKSTIKLDKSLLKMKGLDNSLGTSLKNSLGEKVFYIAPIKEVNLEEISKNFEVIKKEALVIQEKAKSLGFVPQAKLQQANGFSTISLNEKEENQVATDTENIVYEAPKSESFVAKLTNFIKRVFSN